MNFIQRETLTQMSLRRAAATGGKIDSTSSPGKHHYAGFVPPLSSALLGLPSTTSMPQHLS